MVSFEHMIAALVIIILMFTGSDSGAEIYKYVSDDGSVFFTNTHMGKNSKVVIKEDTPQQPTVKKNRVPYISKEAFHGIVEEKARQHNIDPELVKAVIKAESNWNPSAVSPKGAQGLMQLMPSTAFDMGVVNPFNPEENIEGGTKYLKFLLEKFNGNLILALAAYNAGPQRVEKINSVPSIPETREYVRRVINQYSGKTGGTMTVASISEPDPPRIKKIVRKDGTVLFTNSFYVHQDL